MQHSDEQKAREQVFNMEPDELAARVIYMDWQAHCLKVDSGNARRESFVSMVAAALGQARREGREEATLRLSKNQPCGCVICTCEDVAKCWGCGAKNCYTHPVGKFEKPVYEPSRLVASLQARISELEQENHKLYGGNGVAKVFQETLEELRTRVRELEQERDQALSQALVMNSAQVGHLEQIDALQNMVKELTRKGEGLCNAYGPALIEVHDLKVRVVELEAALKAKMK